ncbi:MAG TPA: glycosyltransferase, partial [Dehalococcoidia bacterium]|nr:glycosyltransferase [Dehalococcoidia bacterium]
MIDLRLAGYQAAGIGRSALRLTAALAARDPGIELTALTPARGAPLELPRGIRVRSILTPPHHRWERALLTAELVRERADVFHWPDFLPAAQVKGRSVATIHDLAFLRRPDFLTPGSRGFYSRVPAEATRADAIIAVSETTRADVVATLGVPPDRVTVIHHGLDPAFRPDPTPDDEATRARYGLTDRYLLYVGTVEPRKNLVGLIRAFDRARSAGLSREMRLVLAGAPGWLAESTY